jgi:hypothetical protein
VEEEPPQKLLGGDSHQPLLAVVGIIFPAKSDVAISNIDDPVIGDGDAMRVAVPVRGGRIMNLTTTSRTPVGPAPVGNPGPALT